MERSMKKNIVNVFISNETQCIIDSNSQCMLQVIGEHSMPSTGCLSSAQHDP